MKGTASWSSHAHLLKFGHSVVAFQRRPPVIVLWHKVYAKVPWAGATES